VNHEEQQAFLLSTFREEMDGHVVNLTREFVEVEEVGATPAQTERVREIMRILHTIKGAARMMGFPTITRMAHVMEELVGNYRDRQPIVPIPRSVIDLSFEGIDVISELTREATRLTPGQFEPSPLTAPEFVDVLIGKMAVIAGKPELANPADAPRSAPVEDERPLPQINFRAAQPSEGISATAPTENRPERPSEDTIRVRLDKLDDLINLAGELVIHKQQNEEHLQELQDLLREARSRSRMAHGLRDYIIERTPVEERSRLLGITELFSFERPEMPDWIKSSLAVKTETNGHGHTNGSYSRPARESDVFGLDAQGLRKVFGRLEEMIEIDERLEQKLVRMTRERKAYNLRFGADADEIRRNMLGIRMLPLDTIFNRFARPVRDLAYERGKEIRFIVEGGSIEVDKRILEQIADPLVHMLRNSIDHGIEATQQRIAHGKPAEGTLKLAALQKGSHVLIQVEDDGAGLSPQRLRDAAVSKGYMDATTANALSDEAVLDLIYRPGFSTRPNPDEVSGRGIGMDVVQQNIKRLNGRMVVQNQPGKGVTFTMEIPLTLATVDALLIRSAGQLFALPSVMVAGTLQYSDADLSTLEGRPVYQQKIPNGNVRIVPVFKLNEILGLATDEDAADNSAADANMHYGVLLSAGAGAGGVINDQERLICFEVEALVDEREVVVKALSSFLDKTPNIAGVTVLGADGLALILDVFGLVQSVRFGSVAPLPALASSPREVPVVGRRTLRILVVDDSLATRELERSILETAGFKVDTARDGVEALNIIRENRPDLVLSDVEMPNMDGFKLSAAIRADEKLQNLPVIIVSSRDSEEDRRRGMESGARAYIVKGQFEQNKLLDTIRRLVV
jgi:two-component system, chemotaxis family, sensor kinase CheA